MLRSNRTRRRRFVCPEKGPFRDSTAAAIIRLPTGTLSRVEAWLQRPEFNKMTKPRLIGYDATFNRPIWLLELPHILAPFDWSELQSAKFICLSAMDASSAQTDDLSPFCSHLIDLGCAYYCAWGPDCERVHDIMDGLVVGDNPPETYIGCLMTTWHAKESMAEAVDFFLTCTVPDEEFAPIGCSFGLAVVVGSHEWASQIEQHVREWTIASSRENVAKCGETAC